MSDLIEKQAIIDALLAKMDTIDDKPEVVLGLAVAAGMIKDMPSVTPAEKVGYWIYDRTRDLDGECKYECSECGMGSDVDYAYCMRCGCKMQEVDE